MAQASETSSVPTAAFDELADSAEECMEVDDDGVIAGDVALAEDLEEGEIDEPADEVDTLPAQLSRPKGSGRIYENVLKGGLDLASEEGKRLLEERAQRFSMPEEQKRIVPPVIVEVVSRAELDAIYSSLSMSDVETPYEKQGYRLDAVHMRGTQDMSTDDVFSYFRHYKPASLEWVNDVCCNVVWLDSTDAARAMQGLSRPISGLSLPRSNKYEDADAPVEDQTMEADAQDQENKAPETDSASDAVAASDLQIPIPPGYWRYGGKSRQSKGILLRFAKQTDKKPASAEGLSEYYRKHGNPNHGG